MMELYDLWKKYSESDESIEYYISIIKKADDLKADINFLSEMCSRLKISKDVDYMILPTFGGNHNINIFNHIDHWVFSSILFYRNEDHIRDFVTCFLIIDKVIKSKDLDDTKTLDHYLKQNVNSSLYDLCGLYIVCSQSIGEYKTWLVENNMGK